MADKVKFDRFQDVETYLKTGKYSANRNENKKRAIRNLAKKFAIEGGELLYIAKGARRHVLHTKSDVERVLRECHDNSAHQGTRRTQDKASLHYYWPSMTHDVNEWAVIFAIQQLGGLTRDEAEELFRNYVPHSQD